MDNYRPKIENHPASHGRTLAPALQVESFSHIFHYRVSKRVQHAVAGPGADDEIVCKGLRLLDIEEQYVLPLLSLKGVYNGVGKVQSVQVAPLLIGSGF